MRSSPPSSNTSASGPTPPRRSSRWVAALSLPTACAIGFGSGCAPKVQLVPMPDSPALVLEGQGKVRISMYDPEAGKLLEVGWVDASQLAGLTVVDFNWTVATRPVQ